MEMSYVLPRLETKKDVDVAIKGSEDKVLVLRFGREDDAVCMQLDDVVSYGCGTANKIVWPGRVAGAGGATTTQCGDPLPASAATPTSSSIPE